MCVPHNYKVQRIGIDLFRGRHEPTPGAPQQPSRLLDTQEKTSFDPS